ncbi:hypothetical protein [Archangium lansingense]|uniref:Lipoprotein n=1 Tax=Archangium lansingense TaxID=2995310 RepID=A0ABT4ALZ0_9BACT|nr:hypothetical protein [Archangium lansinium]MCY1082725.1 hypothetical protein [Archangium lansinium]
MMRWLNRRAVPSAALWLGLVAALGCNTESRKTEAARATVQSFFEALPAGDCAVLGPLLTGKAGDTCQATVEEMNEHGLSLVEVLDARVDGRDSSAVVVRARVARDGQVREEPMLLRVEQHPEGWKLRL